MIVIDSVLFFLLVLLICEHALDEKSMNDNFLKKVRNPIQIFCPDFKAGWCSAIKKFCSVNFFLTCSHVVQGALTSAKEKEQESLRIFEGKKKRKKQKQQQQKSSKKIGFDTTEEYC